MLICHLGWYDIKFPLCFSFMMVKYICYMIEMYVIPILVVLYNNVNNLLYYVLFMKFLHPHFDVGICTTVIVRTDVHVLFPSH
jgi:hypothetical protein